MSNVTTIERINSPFETGGELFVLEYGRIRDHHRGDRETVEFRRCEMGGERSGWAVDVYFDDDRLRTPAEARALALAILEAADEVERRNTDGLASTDPATTCDVFAWCTGTSHDPHQSDPKRQLHEAAEEHGDNLCATLSVRLDGQPAFVYFSQTTEEECAYGDLDRFVSEEEAQIAFVRRMQAKLEVVEADRRRVFVEMTARPSSD